MPPEGSNGNKLYPVLILVGLALGGVGTYNSTDAKTEINELIASSLQFIQKQIDNVLAEIADARLDIDDLRDRVRTLERDNAHLIGEFEEYKRTHP